MTACLKWEGNRVIDAGLRLCKILNSQCLDNSVSNTGALLLLLCRLLKIPIES